MIVDQNTFESILNKSEGGVNIADSAPADESSGGMFMKMNPAIVRVWKKQNGWNVDEKTANDRAQGVFRSKVYAQRREERKRYRNKMAQINETSSNSAENPRNNR
jgi:hypothetical protein